MSSSHTATLKLKKLPKEVTKAHIFPTMNKSLLSLGTFCDNDYTIILTKSEIEINHNVNKKLNLNGYRDTTTGMWMADISPKEETPVIPQTYYSNKAA